MSTSRRPRRFTVSLTSASTASVSRTSTSRARAEPPASVISRATVLMVDCDEFGSGGNSEAGILDASEVVLAATTTVGDGGIHG